MATSDKIKISFTLDDEDLAYFRKLFRSARKQAAQQDEKAIVKAVEKLIREVRDSKRVPGFISEAVVVLEDMIEMLRDEEYALPKKQRTEVGAALSYFVNPEDLIPDQIPGLGFLDDAIMIKILEAEFTHELKGYRKFRKFRTGSEQRPWTSVAKGRRSQRLSEYRTRVRAEIDEKTLIDYGKKVRAEVEKKNKGRIFSLR